MGDVLVHEAPTIHLGRRTACRGEARVARQAGIGVACQGLRRKLAVGRDDGHALVLGVVVHNIVLPCRSKVIDVCHEHAFSRGILVPPALVEILHHVELVGIGFVDNLVARTPLAQRRQGYMGRVVQLDERLPPETVLLVGRIAAWGMPVVVVAPVIHDTPHIHAEALTTRSIVKVGEPEAVRELVTEGTDAVKRRTLVPVEFVVAGIASDLHSVEIQWRVQLPLMGPDGILQHVGIGGLAVAGIDDVEDIHIAVLVVVVIREAYHPSAICFAASVRDHLART